MSGSPKIIIDAASTIVASVSWISGLLLGSLATLMAVIAVALVGAQMLLGNLAPKVAFRVVLGCFILFGAPQIATGIIAAAREGTDATARGVAPAAPGVTLPKEPPVFDPYAGAATPVR